MRFVEKCDELYILLLILLSYSIHRLQPFDVFLFLFLLYYYLADANVLMFDNIKFINLFKRVFWSIFYSAWMKAFISINIASGFIKTGIFFYNLCIVFDIIIKSILSVTSNIPVISKIFVLTRCMQKIYKNTPTRTMIKKLILRNERLIAQHDLDKHMIRSLYVTFKKEKRKR